MSRFENAVFDREFTRAAGANARIIEQYKDRLGIKVLPKPQKWGDKTVSADTVTVYRPDFDKSGEVLGYRPVPFNKSYSALLGAIAKGFLLAPMDEQDESETEPAVVEPVVEFQVDSPIEQSSLDTEITESFVCSRKWANGKECGREYKTQGRYLDHLKKKHTA